MQTYKGERLQKLMDSISHCELLSPIIVRPVRNGKLVQTLVRLLDEKKITFEDAYIISNMRNPDKEYSLSVIKR